MVMNPCLHAKVFSPSDIPGLFSWLDASQPSTILNALGAQAVVTDDVATWNARSGANAVTITSGARPVLGATYSLKGFPGIYFDGTNDGLTLGTGLNAEATIFAVTQREEQDAVSAGQARMIVSCLEPAAAFGMILATGRSGSANGNNVCLAACGGTILTTTTIAGSTTSGGVDGDFPNYTPVVLGGLCVSAGSQIYKDGTLIDECAATTSVNASTYPVRLGCASNDTRRYKGWLYEVVIYTRALTTLELGTVSDYLEGKWL